MIARQLQHHHGHAMGGGIHDHTGSESGSGMPGIDMGGGMHMTMYLSDRPGAFLFAFWNPNTDGWYALSCIIVILLGVIQAVLALLRDRLARRVLADARKSRRRAKRSAQQQRLARTHSNDKVLAIRSTPLVSNVGGPDGGADGGAAATALKVDGMTCDTCIGTIRASLLEVAGVTGVRGDLACGRIHVAHAPGANTAVLVGAVEDVGFDAAVDAPASGTGGAAARSYGSIQSASDTAAQQDQEQGGGDNNDGGGATADPYRVAEPIAAWHQGPAALKTFVMLANAGSVTLGYFLMLIAMTFNWGLFLSVVAGISCGYAILLREKMSRRRKGGSGVGGGAGTGMLFDELPAELGDCCA